MRTHHILRLVPGQLLAYRWQSGHVRASGRFTASPDGLEQFAGYLRTHRKETFALLGNLGDEDYQTIRIPALRGNDRHAVVSRKLAQLCAGSPHACARSLGPERDDRLPAADARNDSDRVAGETLLLATLGTAERFSPWTAALRIADVRLTGVHAVPFLAEPLLETLGYDDRHCLLLCHQEHGVQEIHCEDGRLRFSRFAPPPQTADALPAHLVAEAAKLSRFLKGQHAAADTLAPRMIVIAETAKCAAISDAFAAEPSLPAEVLSAADCARRVGLKSAMDCADIDALFAHLCASAVRQPQFASPSQLCRHLAARWQRRLVGTAACVLTGSLLWAAWQFAAARQISDETTALRAEAAAIHSRHDQRTGQRPAAPVDRQNLQRIVALQATLEHRPASPEAFFVDLASALERTPSIELAALEWRTTADVANSQDAADESATLRLNVAAAVADAAAEVHDFIAALADNPRLSVRQERQAHAAARPGFILHVHRQSQ